MNSPIDSEQSTDQAPSNQPDSLAGSTESTSENETPLTSATTNDIPGFGWSAYAERVNGRFAMIGFASILFIELLSNDSFLHWSGLIP